MTPTRSLRGLLASAAILTDFDGTLAPIVADPAAAVPGPGAVEVLLALAEVAPVVGVISGRPVEVLVRHLSDERLHLAGLYGLERREHGEVADAPGSLRWLGPVAGAAADLTARLPDGVTVEPKRLSLTVHFRRRPEVGPAVAALADEIASAHGLMVRPARRSIEVHPPQTPDKGVVVEDLALRCSAACFLGDDVGDIPAFDALDRLARQGVLTVRVAVESDESTPELLDRADVVVPGSSGAVAWLRSLLAP
ncbi:trehalose-phosphatase [Iamia sp.]|uniref:trehalose-phosphatase n=1 Tax=Iamia sp. TaxID=2722710 RepID=UPI002CFB94D2|nr:trehalose-phosphatase [Iamia sp.]HXH55940.1 trehalose-phosphatase [Iamia sp.]